jgi:glutathione S-transferase
MPVNSLAHDKQVNFAPPASDVLRLVDRFDGLARYPACREYIARASARPCFIKAHADQVAHFASAD